MPRNRNGSITTAELERLEALKSLSDRKGVPAQVATVLSGTPARGLTTPAPKGGTGGQQPVVFTQTFGGEIIRDANNEIAFCLKPHAGFPVCVYKGTAPSLGIQVPGDADPSHRAQPELVALQNLSESVRLCAARVDLTSPQDLIRYAGMGAAANIPTTDLGFVASQGAVAARANAITFQVSGMAGGRAIGAPLLPCDNASWVRTVTSDAAFLNVQTRYDNETFTNPVYNSLDPGESSAWLGLPALVFAMSGLSGNLYAQITLSWEFLPRGRISFSLPGVSESAVWQHSHDLAGRLATREWVLSGHGAGEIDSMGEDYDLEYPDESLNAAHVAVCDRICEHDADGDLVEHTPKCVSSRPTRRVRKLKKPPSYYSTKNPPMEPGEPSRAVTKRNWFKTLQNTIVETYGLKEDRKRDGMWEKLKHRVGDQVEWLWSALGSLADAGSELADDPDVKQLAELTEKVAMAA